MRLSRLLAVLPALLLGAVLPSEAHAADKYLGTITVASTSAAVNNSTTGAPFTIPVNSTSTTWVRVQCDLPAFVTFDGTAATSAIGVKYDTDQLSPAQSMANSTTVSVVGVTASSTNCRVFTTDSPRMGVRDRARELLFALRRPLRRWVV